MWGAARFAAPFLLLGSPLCGGVGVDGGVLLAAGGDGVGGGFCG